MININTYTCPLCKSFFHKKMNSLINSFVCECRFSIKSLNENILYLNLPSEDNRIIFLILDFNKKKTYYEFNYKIILTLNFLMTPKEIIDFNPDYMNNFI